MTNGPTLLLILHLSSTGIRYSTQAICQSYGNYQNIFSWLPVSEVIYKLEKVLKLSRNAEATLSSNYWMKMRHNQSISQSFSRHISSKELFIPAAFYFQRNTSFVVVFKLDKAFPPNLTTSELQSITEIACEQALPFGQAKWARARSRETRFTRPNRRACLRGITETNRYVKNIYLFCWIF